MKSLMLAMSAGLLGMVYLASGCMAEKAEAPSERVKKFLSPRAVEILGGAAKAQVFRVDPKDHADPAKLKEGDVPRIGGYKITASGKEQGKEFAAKVTAILFNDRTYLFNLAKGCIFDPGVAYRLWKDKDYVDVLLCFSCDELEVFVKNADGTLYRAHEDFDPMRAELVKLAKEAFPDDQQIQALKEKGGK